ncbi:amino acid permease [Pseudonocardia zijingensis]|uniref:Amino acid permease n=1 Tax=Pseudonocardia zijingensis TaxID=153376 RepID=A0ABN1P8R2_9PSEU
MAATEGAQRTDDEAILHRLGYAQVLYREMGGFSNFAISFTIISILAGCLTSYYLAFNNGGPVAVTWGWLLVGAFCILVAMAMGEIASAMPTAGALYFWASKLGGPTWGWFTGWFNLVGEIAVTAAIQYGSAIFATALLNLWFPGMGNESGTIFIVFTVIAALQLGLNLLNINVLALLNTISAWWHMVGVAVVVAVLIAVPDNHQSAAFVFGETINNSGFSDTAFWFVFGIGLLMSQYTITGFDASAHMSEETRGASRTAALGMIMAVVASVVFGFILLVAVTFAVPDVQGVIDAGGDAVIYIWTEALGDTWTQFLLIIAVIAQLFCGTASVTASSRMMFAFSRDRAVPFHNIWRKVASNRAPVNAVTAICVLSWALMLPTLVNGVLGYAVGTSIAVIGLYIAFGLPIILRIKAGDRFEPGAWSLGKHYKWVSTIAVVWIGLVCILFLMPLSPAGVPFSEEFDWEAVNYAPITVFGALVLFGGWYLLSARTWFTGPVPEGGSLAELQSIEDQLEAEAHGAGGPGAAKAPAAPAAAGGVAVAEKVDTTDDAAEKAPEKNDTAAGDSSEKATEEKATEEDAGEAVEKPEQDAGAAEVADAAAEADAPVKAEAEAPAEAAADATEADTQAEAETAAVAPSEAEPAAETVAEPEPEPVAEPVAEAPAAAAAISPEVRAELKEELKAELKSELLEELKAELKTAGAANGRSTRSSSTRTSKTTRSRSSANGKAKAPAESTAEAAAEPDAGPDAETPAK